MKPIVTLIIFFSVLFLTSCSPKSKEENISNDLYSGFQDPPAEARPFVRWWWNGNKIQDHEINRQLDILQEAGIGGVEINPIAFPKQAEDLGIPSLTWLSEDWNALLVQAAKGAQERGMIADMIVGSGWPFGGEFLQPDETIQRIITHSIDLEPDATFSRDPQALIEAAIEAQQRSYEEAALDNSIFFARMVPVNLQRIDEMEDLSGSIKEGRLSFQVPEGQYKLIYGVRQYGHREVMHGAIGAAGPVMDHYKEEVTRAYLSRLKKISEDTGVPLSEVIRALFCDSIELAGANWTDDFAEIFEETYGYKLETYYPFVFYDAYAGYVPDQVSEAVSDTLRRVRYDYNRLLVELFLENFTEAFQEYCTENGLKARYQAYGTPFLMGMMKGNMITDIPESNNWMYSSDMDTPAWTWNQGHGYMVWNLYAASGAHLTGKPIVSCEAMTNTRGVFKMALEEIKLHDDMNFISGINHSILHGYNYSPKEAEFPGWIRYGGYFDEENTWWPYFPKWVDYNARLSYVFQQTQPQKKIAIVGPQSDLWSDNGLTRVPFHMEPWYVNRMWESISQSGSSCDYISEDIIIDADVSKGKLSYGPMSFEAVILGDIESIRPETAQALLSFVEKGGTVICVNQVPSRSLSLKQASEGNDQVQRAMETLQTQYANRFHKMEPPESEASLLSWTQHMLGKIGISPDVKIAKPDPEVFQIYSTTSSQDLYFFTNTHRREDTHLELEFPVKGKALWRWDPETGTRTKLLEKGSAPALNLHLGPMESALLVFEMEEIPGTPTTGQETPGEPVARLEGEWAVTLQPVQGPTFTRNFPALINFAESDDPELQNFAGTVTYSRSFENDGSAEWLDLGNVNRGITEVYVNGVKIGTHWYGKHSYWIGPQLKAGENELKIVYTTVLSNYCRSLENPTARRWTRGYDLIPVGLEGPVTLYAHAAK